MAISVPSYSTVDMKAYIAHRKLPAVAGCCDNTEKQNIKKMQIPI
jgi:hypothetical protein